jgi:hairy-and-enhancer-of-split protein
LRRQQRLATANPVIHEDRFRAGFKHAANEVSRVLAAIPGVDIHLGTKLMTHLGHSLNGMDKSKPLSVQTQGQVPIFATPPISPTSSLSSGYSSNNSVSVIMNTQTASRNGTPPNHPEYQLPLTPMSSRCSQISQTPSPRPNEHHHSDMSLLKVVNFQQHQHHNLKYIAIKSSAPSLWRPF